MKSMKFLVQLKSDKQKKKCSKRKVTVVQSINFIVKKADKQKKKCS